MPTSRMAMILTVIASLIGAVGAFMLKKGAQSDLHIKKQLGNYKAIIGLILLIISGLVYLNALKSGELSVLFPISSLTYVWILILGHYFLGEHIVRFKVMGVILIIFGILFVVR